MKRMLIFTTAYLPFIGGAEVAVKEITDRIGSFDKLRTGFEFNLITAKLKTDLPAKEKLGNITVYRIGFGFWLDKFLLPIFGLLKALSLHKQKKYSLAWAMMASQASVAAVFFTRLKKIKLLTTLQEGDKEKHLKRYVLGNNFLFNILIKPWHTLAIKNADHIQVISSYLAQRAKAAGAKCQITIIPNGVTIRSFARKVPKHELDLIRERLGIKQHEKIIISVSRLVHKNDLDTLIKSLKYLTGVKLILIGSGELENKLKNLTHELSLYNKVLFLGNIDNTEIPKYLSMADIFVRPSRSEGQGISFIEAMATGVPIIAPPVGGIPDFLKDSKTGLFMKPEDPQDLADKIKLLLEDENLRNNIIKNAQDLVIRKYKWDDIAQDMNNLFLKLIN